MNTNHLYALITRNILDGKYACPVFVQVGGEEGKRLVKRVELHVHSLGSEELVIVPETREEMRKRTKTDKP